MPDVHAGKGCVIGFTANLGDKVIPNIVGIDICCGMLTAKFAPKTFDLRELDNTIQNEIPFGRNTHDKNKPFNPLKDLYCFSKLHDIDRLYKSIGTLGGGNHFIEVDVDEGGFEYLVIHSGSRNLGVQVAKIYQDIAIKTCDKTSQLNAEIQNLIQTYKILGKEKEIDSAIKELKEHFVGHASIERDFAYLENSDRVNYLHDMQICQEYAIENRYQMLKIILKLVRGLPALLETFETIHNYIDIKENIVRKGAISAQKGEKVLIPLNMRDGCIIGYGKGNVDWNCSAPHGAGRLLSRSKAKEFYSLEEFQKSMQGIFTTSVTQGTIDECPMVYKDKDEIINNIADTVEVEKVIKPIYNFKAQE